MGTLAIYADVCLFIPSCGIILSLAGTSAVAIVIIQNVAPPAYAQMPATASAASARTAGQELNATIAQTIATATDAPTVN